MTELVFFLEEPSAKKLLISLLPRILPESIKCTYHVFEGKQDLDKKVGRLLKNYHDPQKNKKFIILRDKDAADCYEIKRKICQITQLAGKAETLVRIACHELESWYLADLAAVEKAFALKNFQNLQQKAKYRSPDAIANPSQELKKITNNLYQKIAGSHILGQYLDPENTRSESFKFFISGIQSLLSP